MNESKQNDTSGLEQLLGTGQHIIITGMRVPKDFFVTTGTGQSDIAIHAGSYHLALKQAGIEMCNIMTYSSILPAIAHEIERPPSLMHGAVMETILAQADAVKGGEATAGIIYAWLHERKTGKKYGGLVCEYHGDHSPEQVSRQLSDMLMELYSNGFSQEFKIQRPHRIIATVKPEKNYGTAVAALCFVNYVFPIQNETGESK